MLPTSTFASTTLHGPGAVGTSSNANRRRRGLFPRHAASAFASAVGAGSGYDVCALSTTFRDLGMIVLPGVVRPETTPDMARISAPFLETRAVIRAPGESETSGSKSFPETSSPETSGAVPAVSVGPLDAVIGSIPGGVTSNSISPIFFGNPRISRPAISATSLSTSIHGQCSARRPSTVTLSSSAAS